MIFKLPAVAYCFMLIRRLVPFSVQRLILPYASTSKRALLCERQGKDAYMQLGTFATDIRSLPLIPQ